MVREIGEGDYFSEAIRLIDLIEQQMEETEKPIMDKEDYLFFLSIKNRVKLRAKVSAQQIYWLRDIKDKQLERG